MEELLTSSLCHIEGTTETDNVFRHQFVPIRFRLGCNDIGDEAVRLGMDGDIVSLREGKILFEVINLIEEPEVEISLHIKLVIITVLIPIATCLIKIRNDIVDLAEIVQQVHAVLLIAVLHIVWGFQLL